MTHARTGASPRLELAPHPIQSMPHPRERRRNPSATRDSLCRALGQGGEIPHPPSQPVPCPWVTPCHALGRGRESISHLCLRPQHAVSLARYVYPRCVVPSSCYVICTLCSQNVVPSVHCVCPQCVVPSARCAFPRCARPSHLAWFYRRPLASVVCLP